MAKMARKTVARRPLRRRSDQPLEHACERCGCTESAACPGGCGWDPAELARGHYVCTACTGAGAGLAAL